MAGLGAGAAAKFHQPTSAADQAGNFIYVVAKDLVFGSRGIIFLQLADFVEQPRALLVVEKLARERFLRLGKSGNASDKKPSRAGTTARSMEKAKSCYSYEILCQADSHELPASVGWKKIAVGFADV